MEEILAIVIPAYKITYLRETLESISRQTDKRFNLYIGDDCSPYDIESVVKEYENKIPLTYKRFDTNLGGKDLVAQWERCIEMTKDEEYIWLFSDDDTMDPECVASFYKVLSENRDDELFHFNINMIDDLDGGKIKTLPLFPERMTAGEYLESKLRGKILSFVVEFIFSRVLYKKVDGFQNFDLAWGSDFMTWLKMSVNCKGILTITGSKDCCVNWRKSSENISPDKSYPIIIRKIKSLIKNAAFIKDLMLSKPHKFQPLIKSFRWLRFPLGEIYRSKDILRKEDILYLCKLYIKNVGYPIIVLFIYLRILIKK